jgi:capsular polysaccharide biosynthesis protein
LNDKGILEIKAYHKDKNQLSQIAQAVNYVLKINHQDYHGGGSNVNVKVIEGPVYSTWYTKPNIIANYVIGLLFGLIVGMSFVYLFPNYSLNLFKRKKELKWEEDQAGKGFDPEDSHDDILG